MPKHQPQASAGSKDTTCRRYQGASRGRATRCGESCVASPMFMWWHRTHARTHYIHADLPTGLCVRNYLLSAWRMIMIHQRSTTVNSTFLCVEVSPIQSLEATATCLSCRESASRITLREFILWATTTHRVVDTEQVCQSSSASLPKWWNYRSTVCAPPYRYT